MQSGELKGYIERCQFPNRMNLNLMKFRKLVDIDGSSIPLDTEILFYDPRNEPVRMRGETVYGLYNGEPSQRYWVSIKDADFAASRAHGYTGAKSS